MTPPVNAFAETAALYAILNADDRAARGIVHGMHASERALFSVQLSRLAVMVEIAGQAAEETPPTPPDPHAPHHVTVTAPLGKDEYFAATEDWNTTVYAHGYRINAYRIQHPSDCDRLAYGQRCAFDRFADDNAPHEMESWPADSGEYIARYLVHQPTNEQGEPTDVQAYIRFEPASATEETTDATDA